MLARRRCLCQQRCQRRIGQPLPDSDEKRHAIEQRQAIDRRDQRQADGERCSAYSDERFFAELSRQPADQPSLKRGHDHAHEKKEPRQIELAEVKSIARVQGHAGLHP